MAEMTTKELTAYLKAAAELEASVYRQTEAKKAADRSLVYNSPSKKTISRPKDTSKEITEPVMAAEQKLGCLTVFGIYGFIAAPLGILGLILDAGGIGLCLINLLGGCVGLFLFFLSIQAVKKENANIRPNYELAMEAYNKNVAQAKEKYNLEMQEYKRECALADAEYEERRKLADRNYAAAKEAVSLLNTPLDATKQALEQLYAHDIIFPKYRDLVAMCTMYEYFASGRCTELTGPNGAYNLYEAELRQNLIINRLDTIISNLEMIRQNQYMLYQEMKNTNTILENISSDVRQILRSTNEIKEASKITAYCSQVTEKNTEALKYIALIN